MKLVICSSAEEGALKHKNWAGGIGAQSDHSPVAMVVGGVSKSQAAFFNRRQGGNDVGRRRKTDRQARV